MSTETGSKPLSETGVQILKFLVHKHDLSNSRSVCLVTNETLIPIVTKKSKGGLDEEYSIYHAGYIYRRRHTYDLTKEEFQYYVLIYEISSYGENSIPEYVGYYSPKINKGRIIFDFPTAVTSTKV